MSLLDRFKLRFELLQGKASSVSYLKGVFSLLKGREGFEGLKKIVIGKPGKNEDLAFIAFKGQGYEPLQAKLSASFEKHHVAYQCRQEAPYGIHVKALSEQATPLYAFYKEQDLMIADQEAAKGLAPQITGEQKITGYNLKKDGVKFIIERTERGIQYDLGGIKITTPNLDLGGIVGGVSFQDAPLILTHKMSETEFEEAIVAADIQIESRISQQVLGITSESFPSTRLVRHFLSNSLLLIEDVIAWVEANVSIGPEVCMINSALMMLLSEKYLSSVATGQEAQKAGDAIQATRLSDMAHAMREKANAWHIFAAVRAVTDARKCNDQTCMAYADQVKYKLESWIGTDLVTKLVKERNSMTKCFSMALELFDNHPPLNHQPLYMAYKGQNIKQFSDIATMFKSSSECDEIEWEERQSIDLKILEQRIQARGGLVIRT